MDALELFACIPLIIGAVECFAGFKIMKSMMAICGLLIGAVIGVAAGVFSDSILIGVIAIVLSGTILSVLSYKFYLAGVFILTSFLTFTATYMIFENVLASVLPAVIIGLLAICFVRPLVIAITAFSGAGIMLFSAYMVMGLEVNENSMITAILWIPIAVAGISCQYITTQKTKKATTEETFSERKYPGMQRAYRNFCIECGCEMSGESAKCPRCGFNFDN